MMKKKNLIVLFSSLFSVTLFLIVIGLFFDKTDVEKHNGLSDPFDVSPQETIAYVNYSNGKPQLFLYNEKDGIKDMAAEYDENTFIFDPSFSADGATLAFITTNKNKEDELWSSVYFLDLRTKELTEIFSDEATITEVAFNPAGPSLFYMRAGTFENYSPIVGKRPHNFDIYEFDLEEKKHEQKTKLNQYSMESLQLSPDGKIVYFQTIDDANVETAEDTFEARQKIFALPLDRPEEMTVISNPTREVDIFSFAVAPKGNEIIFQSISNADEGGTYEYELFTYSLQSEEESQLTHFGDYVSNPVIRSDGATIYFMRNQKFAAGEPEYQLYKISRNGEHAEEIILPVK